MTELSSLYQEVILDHSRRPRNRGKLEGHSHRAEGYNPLCGDRIVLYLKVEDGKVSGASFEGAGCAISTASASLMTEFVKGRTPEQVTAAFDKFHAMVTSPPDQPQPNEALGKLAVFAGVCEFPARVKCASLCWHTVKNALSGNHELVTTE